MSMSATTVRIPSTTNASAACAVSPPKAYAQAQEHKPPSTSIQKSRCGDFCTAAAAFAALQEITQAREQLRRRQRAPAHRTVTASLHHALSARQAPYHHTEKAEYACAQCEP